MIALAEMLIVPAQKAGMKTPEDVYNYNTNDFPHFHVYELVQIGSPMPSPDSHYHNARAIASLSEEDIKKMTMEDLINSGFETGYPIP